MSTLVPGPPAPRPLDPGTVRSALLIRPRFLGDVCLTLPALDALRAACPSARIGYLVEPESAPLLRGDPRIHELIVVERRSGAAGWARALARIRAFAPDLALDLFCNPRTALWTALSGARVRVGYPGKGWRSAAYTHHVRPRTLSAVEFHLTSLAVLGWTAAPVTPRLHVGEEARRRAAAALAEAGVPPGATMVGFHPGARWPTRRWAPARFAELAMRFLEAEPAAVALLTGSREEQPLAEGILRELPLGRGFVVAGWPIERFVAAQSLCSAFVAGDTGPLHTAVAAGVPTLALMSRNSPAMFFPYPESEGHRAHYARVECSPCHRDVCEDLRCLERLTVEGAWRLLSDMLRLPSRRAGPLTV